MVVCICVVAAKHINQIDFSFMLAKLSLLLLLRVEIVIIATKTIAIYCEFCIWCLTGTFVLLSNVVIVITTVSNNITNIVFSDQIDYLCSGQLIDFNYSTHVLICTCFINSSLFFKIVCWCRCCTRRGLMLRCWFQWLQHTTLLAEMVYCHFNFVRSKQMMNDLRRIVSLLTIFILLCFRLCRIIFLGLTHTFMCSFFNFCKDGSNQTSLPYAYKLHYDIRMVLHILFSVTYHIIVIVLVL